jgi:hypothetical protein
MEKQILNRVNTLTERFADDLKEDSGVSVSSSVSPSCFCK